MVASFRLRNGVVLCAAVLVVYQVQQWLWSALATAPLAVPAARQVKFHDLPSELGASGSVRGSGREAASELASTGRVPAGVPRSCAALHAFWTPHIEWGLRYWGPGMIRVRDVLSPPHTTHPSPLVVQVLAGRDVFMRAVPGARQFSGRAPAALWEVARVVEELRAMLEGEAAAGGATGGRRGGGGRLPDIVMRIYSEDAPSLGTPGEMSNAPQEIIAPGLCANTAATALCSVAPDWSTGWWLHNGFGEEQGMDYQEQLDRIFAAADARPYHTRIGRAVTRGDQRHLDRANTKAAFMAMAPDLLDLGQNFTVIEEQVAATAAAKGASFDAAAALRTAYSDALAGVQNTAYLSPTVHYTNYKVQLSIAGNGYTARLKYLLATGSPTIVMMSTLRGSMEEFFIRAMTPFVHYVPVYSGPMVVRATQWLLAHPQEAAAIGAAGRAFVTQYLSRPALNCWWASFFHAYAARSALDDDARHVRLPLSVHMPPPEPIAGQPRSNRTSQKLAIDTFDLAMEVVETAVRSAADGVRIEGATGDDAAFAQLKALSADDRMRRLAASLGEGASGRSPYVSGAAVLAAAGKASKAVEQTPSVLRACSAGHALLHVPPSWVDDAGASSEAAAARMPADQRVDVAAGWSFLEQLRKAGCDE